MVRTADHDAQPSIRRQTIVNRLDVHHDLTVFRGGRKITVVAQEEHERCLNTCLNDATDRSTVNIDAGLAPGIVAAELQGLRTSKGMPEYADACQVEASRELARRVQLLQSIKYESDVGRPCREYFVDTIG